MIIVAGWHPPALFFFFRLLRPVGQSGPVKRDGTASVIFFFLDRLIHLVSQGEERDGKWSP